MSTFTPTDEQLEAMRLARTGGSLTIEALAGTGKSSTLRLIAGEFAAARKTGVATAFNRAIVEDLRSSFPSNVECKTMHSLAFAQAGRPFQHRLQGRRMRNIDIADLLGMPRSFQFETDDGKVVDRGRLASLVMRGVRNFCQTADAEPVTLHLPGVKGLDLPCDDLHPDNPASDWRASGRCRHGLGPKHVGHKTSENNDALADMLYPFLGRAWQDWQTPNGRLPYDHSAYLKAFSLGSPRIKADFIMVDEAQDLPPVFVEVLRRQVGQIILVGDRQQSIYSFTGAQDAITEFEVANRAWLTQSFRFGQPIAEVANLYLDALDAAMMVRGNPAVTSMVSPSRAADAVLCRTNAGVVREALNGLAAGVKVGVVGGADALIGFAEGALKLQHGLRTDDPNLWMFGTWDEVEAFVKDDPNGDELALLVKLVNDFSAEKIIDGMQNLADVRHADLVVSTAHKAKGLQWSRVRVADGFAKDNPETGEFPSAEELRLQYVAATRAQHALDPEGLFLADFLKGRPEPMFV